MVLYWRLQPNAARAAIRNQFATIAMQNNRALQNVIPGIIGDPINLRLNATMCERIYKWIYWVHGDVVCGMWHWLTVDCCWQSWPVPSTLPVTTPAPSPPLFTSQILPSGYSEDQSSLMLPGELALIKWLSQQQRETQHRPIYSPFFQKSKSKIANRASRAYVSIVCIAQLPRTQNKRKFSLSASRLTHFRDCSSLFGNAVHNLIWFRLSSPALWLCWTLLLSHSTLWTPRKH